MDFKDAYPDYASIEAHIRRARIERSVAVAQMFADIAYTTIRGLRHLGKELAALRRGARVPEWARQPSPHR